MTLRPLLLAAAFAFGFAPASARTSPEELSLEGYGAKTPACVEWNDGCSTCQRDASGAAHCSTPGIACVPQAIVCKSPGPL